MVNKVILVGNVGTDPEIRYVDKRPVARMRLATNEPARHLANGVEIPERTEWHTIVMWDNAAQTAERYITKGTKLYLEGKLRTREWTDRNGIQRRETSVVVDSFDILQRPAAANSQPKTEN